MQLDNGSKIIVLHACGDVLRIRDKVQEGEDHVTSTLKEPHKYSCVEHGLMRYIYMVYSLDEAKLCLCTLHQLGYRKNCRIRL